jgi:ATP adenylyltransferase
MQYLHAYWRIGYVRTPRGKRGSLLDGSAETDSKKLILYRDVYSVIMMNRYPYNAGHLLVLPMRPVTDLDELNKKELAGFTSAILRAQRILKRAMAPDGFNIGCNVGKAAGAGMPEHLHCHVVPRWDGDANFMPIIGQTKVLPQALDALYEELLPHVA